MNFKEFREAVGAADNAVREAVAELKLQADIPYNDMRRRVYKEEWIAIVRYYLQRKAEEKRTQA